MDQSNTWGWVISIIVVLGVLGAIWWWASYAATPGIPSTGENPNQVGSTTNGM